MHNYKVKHQIYHLQQHLTVIHSQKQEMHVSKLIRVRSEIQEFKPYILHCSNSREMDKMKKSTYW